jgi:hypothetical protein
VAAVITLVQTEQIGINVHERNNTKTQYKQNITKQIQAHILPKHPRITTPPNTHTKTHTQPNITKQPQYNTRTKQNSHKTFQ